MSFHRKSDFVHINNALNFYIGISCRVARTRDLEIEEWSTQGMCFSLSSRIYNIGWCYLLKSTRYLLLYICILIYFCKHLIFTFKFVQYELEHEKLEMKLEEERKSQKEREQCIKEQQLKIYNLSNLVIFSDSERNSCQV